jgi:hypothetical protein
MASKTNHPLLQFVRRAALAQGDEESATVWIDPDTHLPLKRLVTAELQGQPVSFTETYTEVSVNEPVDPAVFRIAAK